MSLRSCSLSFHVAGRLAGEALFELVEAVAPELAVRLQPVVELDQRLGAYAIEPPLAIGSHRHQARLTQHPQLLGDRRLAHAEALDEGVDGLLAPAQLLEDAAPG